MTQTRRWGQIAETKPDNRIDDVARSVCKPEIQLATAKSLIDLGLATANMFDIDTDGFQSPRSVWAGWCGSARRFRPAPIQRLPPIRPARLTRAAAPVTAYVRAVVQAGGRSLTKAEDAVAQTRTGTAAPEATSTVLMLKSYRGETPEERVGFAQTQRSDLPI